jgi:predicted enzyme related to lactoylglutathione lyase
MPNIDTHAPGSFCWIELATSDQNAAKTFYTSLFGWNFNDVPTGPNGVYTMFQLQGREVAAAYAIEPAQRAQGVPPHWMIYVAVDSADDAAKRAAELGGTVLAGPFDVYDVGRMAVIKDPTGAVFSVWQAMKHKGIGISGVDGTLCWADLSTPDPARATDFYSKLFGWKIEAGDKGDGYMHIANGNDFIGGVPSSTQRDAKSPPHWLPYFLVSDCDAATAKAKQLGAQIHMDPLSMEDVGRFSVLGDPQGAVFAMFQPARR